jgi:diadenosine tetraphosphate (Ap4A) HIT family hydrolase
MPDDEAASPFLAKPRSEWVAENALAFAIRDGFPVSRGHTLVVPKRLISSWFDATREEQLAILALVDEVKTALDTTLAPQGYNIGVNVGAAARQTVRHMHVHVIPRFAGDVDDPRGGVRHVIPSKGNYLRETRPPLAVGGPADPFVVHVAPLFSRARDIAILAAFIQDSGLSLVRHLIDATLERGTRIRILTGDYLEITQATALERLLDWTELARLKSDIEGNAPEGAHSPGALEDESDPHSATAGHEPSLSPKVLALRGRWIRHGVCGE